MNTLLKNVCTGTFVAAYLLLAGMVSQVKADDTEVYFYQGNLIDSGKPQLVLTLDVTSSMNGKGGGNTTRLQMVREALLAIPDAKLYKEDENGNQVLLGTVKDKAKLSLVAFHDDGVPVLFHMNDIAFFGNTALYDPTKNDKSWDKAVEYIPEGKAYTGSTPLDHAVEESARYILSSLVGHNNTSTDAFSYSTDVLSNQKTYNGFLGANSCGPTTLVIMASGQANSKGYDAHIKSNVITGAGDQASYCTDNECNRNSVVDYLNSEFDVKTYTITPKQNTNKKLYQNLLSMSRKGGTGLPVMFDTTEELTAALTNIIEEVVTQGSSFVQAGVTVSQQNRLEHDNQLYYAQFEPSTNSSWPGNLKKYKFKSDAVRDQNEEEAVDLTTGLFKEDSHSYWTDSLIIDGNNVRKGGAAEELARLFSFSANSYTSSREVYTDKGSTSGLLSSLTIEAADLGINSDGEIGEFTADEAADIVKEWMKGVTYDPATDSYSANKEMGDPLHSEPKLLRYKTGEDADGNAILKTLSIYGTNQGFIHAVNTSDAEGTEEWSYVPGALLSRMKEFYINDIVDNPENRLYGVDGEVTIAHADTNFNLYVDDDEKVIMYVGFRRGGSSYYALDISNGTPSLLFDIHNTDTGFASMGQTWAEPTIANMKIGGEPKAVAIFSAGYDESQDTAGTASSSDSVGNDIFIVNALTGNLLWKASNSSAAGDLKYGMVGKIDTFGFNSLGLAEHFYASDLGGQLFRFDIDNSGSDFSITGKKIASLQGTGGAENNRRFYYGPSVGYFIEPDGTSYMTIAIGSGYRAHPLDKTVQDHVYLVRDEAIFKDEFPSVVLSDLVDITNNFDSADIKAKIDAGKKGWYLSLDKSIGEKVISEVTTTFGKVLVTTYIPEATKVDACTPVVGKGRLYAMNVSDGTPIADLDEDGTDNEYQDRYVGLITPGISPPAQVLYVPDHTSNEDGIAVLVGAQNIGSNVGPKGSVLVKNLPEGWDGVKRVNWKKVEQ